MSVSELFNKEISKSERLRALVLIGLLGLETLLLLIVYFYYYDEYIKLFKSNIAIYAVFIFTSIIIIYEVLELYLLSKKNSFLVLHPRFFGYFNSFSEISLLSLLLFCIIEYSGQSIILQTPATLTYFIFIVLSTFRLNFNLSVFTGLLAAFEFILLSLFYSTHFAEPNEIVSYSVIANIHFLGQGIIMFITGIAAGFVANLIKKEMIISWENIQKKNEIIDLFGQQISPQIAENILNRDNELSGERRNVCIMFLDIRQFTSFVESHPPEKVVAYLNTLFGFMIDIVQMHHGVINQFLGDGFMATFGAPVAIGNSSKYATDAACKIIDRIEEEVNNGDLPSTRIGIGLHFDEAVTGNIGSAVRKQYSITGRVVIMASRIEQLNKKYNTSLLISKEVFDELGEDAKNKFEWLESIKVKGSNMPVSLYRYYKTLK